MSPTAEDCTPEVAALLAAAAAHDLPTLKALLKTTPAQSQHPITLTTPLHAAVGASAEAEEAVRMLLAEGAIWNDLDAAGETPACVAWRTGASGCYELLVAAGVRAELLMARMSEWGMLDSDSEPENEFEEEEEAEDADEEDATPAPAGEWEDVTAAQYLGSALEYDGDKLVDADANGVMMAWETGVMQASVAALLPADAPAPSVLNVGFGMGIVDAAFQARLGASGARHVIVEAHPDVLAKMRADGWMDRPGVRVLAGRWQDVSGRRGGLTAG